jgi:hypothetical protein
MKNIRTYTISPWSVDDFDPMTFCRELMAAGFTFDHIGCPFKITKPWDRRELDDGTAIYRQWDE